MSQEQVLNELVVQVEAIEQALKGKLFSYLLELSKEYLKAALRDEFTTEDLQILYDISLIDEIYEICQAIQEVLNEKVLNSPLALRVKL